MRSSKYFLVNLRQSKRRCCLSIDWQPLFGVNEDIPSHPLYREKCFDHDPGRCSHDNDDSKKSLHFYATKAR